MISENDIVTSKDNALKEIAVVRDSIAKATNVLVVGGGLVGSEVSIAVQHTNGFQTSCLVVGFRNCVEISANQRDNCAFRFGFFFVMKKLNDIRLYRSIVGSSIEPFG